MATRRVVSLLADAQVILIDPDGTRWPRTELLNWLNEAYLSLIRVRPDLNTTAQTYVCAEGSRQTLSTQFPAALRLMDVVRNVAPASRRRSVTRMTRQTFDMQARDWYALRPSIDVQHFVFDPRRPVEFSTFPPAALGAQLEVVFAQPLAPHVLTLGQLDDPATAEVIRVPDIYAPILLDFVLYRAFSKDAEQPEILARATMHRQAVESALGATIAVDQATAPGVQPQ
jgi:hypothetical protein